MVTLSEFFPEVYMSNPNITDIFEHLLTKAKIKDETVNILSLTILANITEVISKYPDPIASNPQRVIEELVMMMIESLSNQLNRDSV